MVLRAAVFGDVHGRQDLMYIAALDWQERHKKSIDVILQVGDFETIRNEDDLTYYFAPKKYHKISEIADYCNGRAKVPILTVFIGGNHEAWGVLADKHQGGYICPKVRYLGRSGTITLNGVTIGGLTGIFSPKKYKTRLSAKPEYDWQYYREEDVENLRGKKLDILLLHDWVRPFSAISVEESHVPDSLRNDSCPTPTLHLIESCQPEYVFMGHMHRAYVRGRIRTSRIYGLTEFRGNGEKHSFEVVEVTGSLRRG